MRRRRFARRLTDLPVPARIGVIEQWLAHVAAQIEIAVGGAIYTTSVNGHIPTTSPGSGSPDIRITVSASDFQALYSSGDMISTARQLYDEGKLSIELKRSEITLALKGYKALYDELQN